MTFSLMACSNGPVKRRKPFPLAARNRHPFRLGVLSLAWLLTAVIWVCLAPDLQAASNMVGIPPRLPRTNAPPAFRRDLRTNAAFAPITRPGAKTNALISAKGGGTNAVARSSGTNAPSGLAGTFRRWQENKAFYPVVIGVLLCLAVLLLSRLFKPAQKKESLASAGVTSRFLAKGYARKPGATAFHAANVLEVGPQARRVWQFDARGGRYTLSREHTSVDGDSLPGKLVGKDWRTLFQRKLNVAWLSPENVFLRVIQLPRSDFSETLSMVELQLEKLSPMPVAQTVWSFHILPQAEGNLQTVVVMIVSRPVVEEFLGRLEGEGFLADRLELPLLDQLQTTAITEDGAWIYPEAAGGKNNAMVAWWYGGVLQNIDLLTLPPAGATRSEALKEQLLQMAWAGELEGWLKSAPEWHLVADVELKEWEPVLRQALEQPIETITPLPTRDLAGLTARRAAQAEPRANLLPAEFSARYRQQFIDRLWMRGLLAVGGIYLAIVAAYMIGLGYATWRTDGVDSMASSKAYSYTNAMQLKTRYQVLKDRQDLKFAALDCWEATAKLLPIGVKLDNLIFSEGKRLSLRGTAPTESVQQLFNFERDLRQLTKDGQLLFDPNKGESLQWRVQGSSASWSVGLELYRSEVQ